VRLSRRRWSGYTAVEVVLVLSIIGIASAMAFPKVRTTVNQNKARRGATVIGSMIEYAFAVAQRTDQPVTITYSSSTGVMTVTDRTSGTVMRRLALKSGSEWAYQSVTFSPTAGITVFPMGLASAALSVTVGSGGYTKTISASRAGVVRIP
jgi:prepilin-type N-terminal cleavage/methylation domain-containing protein